MRFDAYHGNVWEGRFDHVAQHIARKIGGRVERARPRGRYGLVLEVKDGMEPIGWVADDSLNGTVYFEFKGARTPDAVQAIRSSFDPEAHNVSRADICEDYCEPGAHARLVGLIDQSKADSRVTSEAIIPRDGDRGQTVYWGSRKSSLLLRCYEKGKQRENLHLGRPHWARVELQCRPAKSAQKQMAAALDPLAFWGFGRWTKNVAEALTGIDLERFAAPQDAPQFDRTTRYIANTFRRHFEEMLTDFGDWECIGRELEAIWQHEDKKQRRGV